MDERYEWLARLKANHWSLDVNEHRASYVSAREWIEECLPDNFEGVEPSLLQGMKTADTIYRLQVYPDTPIGFYVFYGPTLDSVMDQALQWRSDSASEESK